MKRPLALLLLSMLAASGCAKKASREQCEAILDRYLELSMTPNPELSRLPPAQVESVISAQKAERRSNAAFAQARARCETEVSRAQADCAMSAPSANDWEACLD